ncbi:MAG: PQQ-like beta-propeller repeat protein [Acidobacteria bacterium]|nr:PQQ-like beta-propeller repeat protein [Acidobacteriota bacterium]
MRRLVAVLICCFGCGLVWMSKSKAQSRDWMTGNGDAQRSAWIRTDAKISPESMQKPGFTFLWKLKLNNRPRQLNSLAPPATLERLIGYRGFRMLGFVGGSSDRIFTIDTDLGRMEWEKQLTSTAPARPGTLACPGGMTTGVVRPTLAALPPLPSGGGPGRSNPARSAVGEPGQGAVTLANVRPSPPSPPPAATPRPAQPPSPPRLNPANPPGGQFGSGPFLVYALSSDGRLHSMHLSNGDDYEPPVEFLPPNANAQGLIVVDNVAYVVTDGNCGGVPNGVWALDLVSRQVSNWKGNLAGQAGAAFGGDGTVYVTTAGGGESANSLVALEPKTLTVKDWYTADREFSSSPVIFEYKGRTLIAAATKDGRVHLLDTARPGGADHRTPLYSTRALTASEDFAPGALASWQDAGGTRWILAPTTGRQAIDAGFTGAVTKGAVVAWKIVEQNGSPTLQPGWASRDLIAPLAPTIINGVVFVTSSGEYRTGNKQMTAAQRAQRSSRAVLYALDGRTGKELWSSGATITSFARGGPLSGGMGQIYLTTYDGTIYAFGFPMEH